MGGGGEEGWGGSETSGTAGADWDCCGVEALSSSSSSSESSSQPMFSSVDSVAPGGGQYGMFGRFCVGGRD